MFGRKGGSARGTMGTAAAVCWLLMLALVGMLALQGRAQAVARCEAITFDGGGAGEVVFDGSLHTAKGLSCADCHEGKGLSMALFDMETGSDMISMRSMELGRSCGRCHSVNMSNTLNCSFCHHK